METKRLTIPAAEEILGGYYPVLDNGFVSLVEYLGGDALVERAARTSYAYGTRKAGDTTQLIRSLKRRGHTSPFEMMEFVFHCAMPIFVARQWIRVRTASVNEMSGRYSLMPMLFYTPTEEQIQAQSKKDKQGREGKLSDSVVDRFVGGLQDTYEAIEGDYHWATENDIARELARIDLPLSTYTQWYWKIDGNNLLKTLALRCDPHAQWETRQYFNVIAGMVQRIAPIAFGAWLDYEFYGRRFSHMEMAILRDLLIVNPNSVEGKSCTRVGTNSMQNDYNLTKTEIAELFAKLTPPKEISFDLDMNKFHSPEYFEELFRKSAEGE